MHTVCDTCDKEVNPEEAGTWKLVEGWAQQRKSGGFHGISFPSLPRKYRCKLCMDYIKLTGTSDQLKLF